MKRAVLFFGAAALLLAFAGCSPSGPDDGLRSGFVSPPPSSRPGVYWYFMDGNLSREGITADLESMKKAGLGWVLFLEVNVGVPRGKVDFLSGEWQDLFVHAVRECERLGIRLILGSGPGWAGSGGPWVTPDRSMLHLVAGRTDVTGPGPFQGKLPVPGPRPPFFGEWTLTPELKAKRDAWYDNAAVLAFPTPAAGTTIPQLDDKALYQRAPFTSQPGVPPRLPDPVRTGGTPGAAVDVGSIIDLTGRLRPDGTLDWLVPPGRWTILRFAARNNGAVTRPAPLPGLGFECDKLDASALDAHYKSYVGRLLRRTGRRDVKDAATGGGWTMLHIDSWEMGSQNWSPGFRDEFRKRRGYDPLPFLPAYAGTVVGSLELSERFLWDVRRTAGELVVEKHAERFKELGRREGFTLSIEPYDMNPSADLDLGAAADVPQGEFWSEGHGFNSSFSVIEAVSAAHTIGAPVVAAESFTADSSEAWRKYPGNMKDQTDWALAMGLNRLLFHTFAHQPFGGRLKPGMTMGPYGVHWDRNQTWWPMADAYHLYISRCQYLLAQGRPVADILYLAPEGAPQVFRAPASALEGTAVLPDKRGYSFDGCSPTVLIRNASVENGRIVFPGGASYRLLVLPDIGAMTPELLEKIGSLVGAGALIAAGGPPLKSPSLEGWPDCDARVTGLVRKIWGGLVPKTGTTEHVLGRGRVFLSGGTDREERSGPADTLTEVLYPEYSVTAALLGKLGVRPDFISVPGSLRYTHRSLPGREIYFVSNRTAAAVEETCTFRDGTGSAELWDAVTGGTRPFRHITMSENGAEALIRLEPHQSLFVVFDTSGGKPAARKVGTQAATEVPDFPERRALMTINSPWNVAFDPAWGGPAGVVFDRLEDWTKRPEEGIRHYSGTAVYSTEFDLPDGTATGPDGGLYLHLGEVRHMARVRLNGRGLGTVWTAPPILKLDGPLRKKGNRLEIEVADLWTNRLIGDESEPWDGPADGKWPAWLLDGRPRPTKRFAFAPIRPYKAGDPLEPSGLLGPVRIVR